MTELGRALVAIGLVIAVIGVGLVIAGRIPGLGRLPGDIYIERGNFRFYFPLATSVILSIVLSLVVYLITRR